MKKIIRIIALMSLVVGAAIAANAQMNPSATVNVPFSFNAGDRLLEAGKYNVTVVRPVYGAATLRLQRQGSKEVGTVLLQEFPGESSDDLKLVFSDEGGKKVLAALTASNTRYLLLGGSDSGLETLSKINRSIRSKM